MRYGCINHFSQHCLNNKRRVFLFPSSFLLCGLCVPQCCELEFAPSMCLSCRMPPVNPDTPYIIIRWRQQSLSLLYFSYLDRGKKKHLIQMLKRKKKRVFLTSYCMFRVKASCLLCPFIGVSPGVHIFYRHYHGTNNIHN